MNRKYLIAPLIAATAMSFSANADSGARFGSAGARVTSLSLLSTDSNSDARSTLSGLRNADGNSGFSGIRNASSSLSANRSGNSRPLLAGLSRDDRSDSSLGDRLPKITTSRDNGDGKISQTVDIDGARGGTLKISSGLEHSGQTLQESLQQAGSGKRTLDNTLKVSTAVSGSSSHSTGGDNNALGLGRERSSDSSFSQASSMTVGREGTATARSDDNPSSRDVKRTISSSNKTSISSNRSVAALTDSGSDRSSSQSRDTSYGFKASNGSSRSGLKISEATHSFEPNFKTESDSSNGD